MLHRKIAKFDAIMEGYSPICLFVA